MLQVNKTHYRCEFRWKSGVAYVHSDEGIAAFKDGFWLDAFFNYTKGGKCCYWIPPSQILYIQKETP